MSNRGRKNDGGKLQYHLMPIHAEAEIIKVLQFGAEKYGEDNWRGVENWEERYYDAARRHMEVSRDGERDDEESGRSHVAHAICCLLFILERELE